MCACMHMCVYIGCIITTVQAYSDVLSMYVCTMHVCMYVARGRSSQRAVILFHNWSFILSMTGSPYSCTLAYAHCSTTGFQRVV